MRWISRVQCCVIALASCTMTVVGSYFAACSPTFDTASVPYVCDRVLGLVGRSRLHSHVWRDDRLVHTSSIPGLWISAALTKSTTAIGSLSAARITIGVITNIVLPHPLDSGATILPGVVYIRSSAGCSDSALASSLAWFSYSLISFHPLYLLSLHAVTALAFLRAITRRKRKAGYCVECEYDLRASRETCPECGTAVATRDKPSSLR